MRALDIALPGASCELAAYNDQIVVGWLAKLDHNDIAYMLGFSDTSNFSRAFRRWTGSSPRTYVAQACGPHGAPKTFGRAASGVG